MALVSKMSGDNSELVIHISDRFDFTLHREFREAYENAAKTGTPSRYIVDLKGTEYMDSSALGMLLLLREYAGGDSADITIRHCTPAIKDILAISNFQKLFDIEGMAG
ncbi:MAG TPA: anti-sigma factor antagonist [Gammaproteobacteria bacterium]|nr:anti-sigma factor antagonist [Gammaproteobacteria bacterium]